MQVSNHISEPMGLVCIAMCMHPLQVVCFCALNSTLQITIVKYLYFKHRMYGSKCKSSGDVAGTDKKCQVLYYCTFQVTVQIQKVYFCLLFMYYLCEKYYKHITIQCYIADCVKWVSRLTLSDLQMCSQNGNSSYVGDSLQIISYNHLSESQMIILINSTSIYNNSP